MKVIKGIVTIFCVLICLSVDAQNDNISVLDSVKMIDSQIENFEQYQDTSGLTVYFDKFEVRLITKHLNDKILAKSYYLKRENTPFFIRNFEEKQVKEYYLSQGLYKDFTKKNLDFKLHSRVYRNQSENYSKVINSYFKSKLSLEKRRIKYNEHSSILDKCTDCKVWNKEKDVKDIPEDKYEILLNSEEFKDVSAEFQRLMKVNPREVSERAHNPINNISYDLYSNSKGKKIHVLKVAVGHGCGAPIDRRFGLVFIDGIDKPQYFRDTGIESIFQIEGSEELFFKAIDYPEVSIDMLKSTGTIESVFDFSVDTEGCGC